MGPAARLTSRSFHLAFWLLAYLAAAFAFANHWMSTDRFAFAGDHLIAEAPAAGSAMGRQLEILSARTNRNFGPRFSSAVQKRAEALLISPDPLFNNRLVQLATLATRHAMPTIYTLREFAESGGLRPPSAIPPNRCTERKPRRPGA